MRRLLVDDATGELLDRSELIGPPSDSPYELAVIVTESELAGARPAALPADLPP
jgi:hypothetical protein